MLDKYLKNHSLQHVLICCINILRAQTSPSHPHSCLAPPPSPLPGVVGHRAGLGENRQQGFSLLLPPQNTSPLLLLAANNRLPDGWGVGLALCLSAPALPGLLQPAQRAEALPELWERCSLGLGKEVKVWVQQRAGSSPALTFQRRQARFYLQRQCSSAATPRGGPRHSSSWPQTQLQLPFVSSASH